MNHEESLRRALGAQAQRVEPSPAALGAIRDRIRQRVRRRRVMGLTSAAGAVLATVTSVLIGTVSCTPPPVTQPPPPAGTTTPTPTPTPTPTTAPTSAGTQVSVPVYYLGEIEDRLAGSRLVLYREYHDVAAADSGLAARIAAALDEMLSGDAYDPDYASSWPAAATVRGVRVEGGVAIVDLGGVARNDVAAQVAAMTVEQLVWTVTAVAADARSPVDGVRVLVDGAGASSLWGHVSISEMLHRGAGVDVQAPVWLIAPQQGATVGRNVRVHVSGVVWEATAHLIVRKSDGTVAYDDFVMLSSGPPTRGEAYVELTLEPGAYTVEAFYYSPMDGSVQAMDDHEITVS